jgi:Smg protein
MKESMFEVLLYLFENYFDDETPCVADADSLRTELHAAGFARGQVNRAFEWLDTIARDAQLGARRVNMKSTSIRVNHPEEQKRLDVVCRGFLAYLENTGVLDDTDRELVIDRALALDVELLDVERLKWVVLMVMLNRPGQEQRISWMEHLVSDETPQHLH